MANLFWGVSDALDLYGEYINAKKLKLQRPRTTPMESEGFKKDNSNELLPIVGYLKEYSEDNESNDPDTALDGTLEKDKQCYMNSQEIDDTAGLDISNEIVKKDSDKLQHIEESVSLTELSKKTSLSNEDICKTDQRSDVTHTEKNETIENQIKSAISIIKNNTQSNENYTDTNKISDINLENALNLNEEKNYFRNLAVGIANGACSESVSVNELRTDNITLKIENESFDKDSLTDNNFKDNLQIQKKKTEDLKDESNKNVEDGAMEAPHNSKTDESSNLQIPERQDAGEEPPLFQSEGLTEETSKEPAQKVLNILIFGGGDPRHIIKTMAKRYTHYENEGTASSVPILKFYVVEGCMEIIARNIVLLGIALERPELISLRNKVHLFMDIYGNSLLRPICYQYLISKSATLLKMVSDRDTLNKIAPFIHIDNLKFRETDALQDAFDFWQPKPGYDFNIKDYWMTRLRRLLAVRYDAREGVFDWDLNMSLKDRGGEQICSQEYRYWRETGIAFTFPEYEQCKPNKTLSAGLVRNGARFVHRGYIGDIQTGPFCTFGLRSAEERMHHSAHGENDYRATDVTERNLLEYFHEIQTGTEYVHDSMLSHKYGSVRFQMGERLIHNECDMKGICAYDQPWINVEGIEVHFLPLHEVKEIGKGALKWGTFFDIAFIGYSYFEFVENSFTKVLRENSLLIFETKLRSVEIKNRITEFENELQGFAREANLLSVLNYNALNSKNSILKFWKPEESLHGNIKKNI